MSRYGSLRISELKRLWKLMPPPNPLKWKAHQRELLLQQVKKERATFTGLQSIDPEVKRRLYPAVRRALNRMKTSQSLGCFEQLVLTLAGFLLMAPAAPLFIDLLDKLQNDANVNGWLVATGLITTYLSIFFLPKHENNVGATIAPIWLSVYPLMFLMSLVAISPMSIRVTGRWWFGTIYSLVLGAGMIGMFFLAIVVAAIPMLLSIARRLRRHADARILTKLIALIAKIESHPREWEQLSFRANLTKDLDAIANLFDSGLPAAYPRKDELFQGWMTARCRRIATHIRNLKSWLAIPRSDTRNYFLKELGLVLICLGHGDWDCIPQGEAVSGSRRARGIVTLLSGLRTLLASVLPAAILVLLHVLHRDPPLQISAFLTFGAAAWLMVGCISLLDPLYSSRTEAFKAALQFLPGIKKD